MTKRIHVISGRVSEYEEQGFIAAFGSTLKKYHFRPDGSYGYTYYGDHQCGLDRFDIDIEANKVPEDIRAILGQPISSIREMIAERYELVIT